MPPRRRNVVNRDDQVRSLQGEEDTSLVPNSGDRLTELPDELLVLMMSFLPDQEIRTVVPYISHRFNDVYAMHFTNTLYGRSLHFQAWEASEIKRLKEEIDAFLAPMQITLFNRPHESRIENFFHHLILGTSILSAIFSVLAVAWLFWLYLKSREISNQLQVNISTSQQFKIFLPFLIVLGGGAYTVYNSFSRLLGQDRIDNLNYQAAAISPEQFGKLQDFMASNAPFFENNFLPIHSVVNGAINGAMRDRLKQSLIEIRQYADELHAHLQTKRFSNQAFLTPDEVEGFRPGLAVYTRQAASFWARNNARQLSILPPIETEGDEPQNELSPG